MTRKLLKRIGTPLAALLLGIALAVGAHEAFWPGDALSQANTIVQNGNAVAGHAMRWVGQRMAADAGGVAGGASGTTLTELGVTNSGKGFCQNSAPITPGPYSAACWGYDASGNFNITVDGVGQAAPGANVTVNGVRSSLTGIAAAVVPQPPAGRLTLQSGTPIMNTNAVASGLTYWTPYGGGMVPIWNGSAWTLLSCNEITNTTSNSAVGNAGPAAVANNSTYDLFIWSNGGTCTLTRSPAWSNATTRTLALANQNGIPVNAGSITNGPGANLGTYVGTVASNASSTIDWLPTATANTAGRLMVYNHYNRVGYLTAVIDTEAQYTYTSSTVRQAGGQTYSQISWVAGAGAGNIPEEAGTMSYTQCFSLVAASGAQAFFGFGFDSTTAFSRTPQYLSSVSNLGGTSCSGISSGFGQFGLTMGVHTVSANEGGDGTNANTFNRNANGILTLYLRM